MTAGQTLFNGDEFERLVQAGVEDLEAMTEMFVDLLTSGSVPPGGTPITDEHMEFVRLVQLRDSMDPLFTEDGEAKGRLVELAGKFGVA